MAYCTKEEVNSLFGDISDEISDELFVTVIDNSTSWVDSNLQRAYVPLPEVVVEEVEPIVDDVTEPVDDSEIIDDEVTDDTETTTEETTTEYTSEHNTTVQYNLINVPSGLRTAAIYYAASDILLSLYHGDSLPVQYDVWFQKAQMFLDNYIEAYKHSEAEEADLVAHQQVKHSHSKTYNQKRGRRTIWVR